MIFFAWVCLKWTLLIWIWEAFDQAHLTVKIIPLSVLYDRVAIVCGFYVLHGVGCIINCNVENK